MPRKLFMTPPPLFEGFGGGLPKLSRRLFSLALAALFCLPLLCGCTAANASREAASAAERWPEISSYPQLAASSVQEYWNANYNFRLYLPEGSYDPYGDLMNWGVTKRGQYQESETGTLDENGVFMLKIGDELCYNPVTVAQQALTQYGMYLRGEATRESFLDLVSFLMEMQAEDGRFPYNYDYPYYVAPEQYFKAGWTSAMATGNVLSVLARAYHLTGDSKYAACAGRAIPFLDIPIEEGGAKTTLAALDPSLSGYTILEEFPTDPPTYTLNGYMFTLVGLYDWSQTGAEGSERAKELFNDGVRTVEKILPYYDIGGFTCYDLSHITWKREAPHLGIDYHIIHIALCKIFYDITGIETFEHYYTLWASYVAK